MIAPDLLGDAVLSWLGALGAFSAWLYLRRGEVSSPQQRRARFLLGTLVALLAFRGFSWILPRDPLWVRLTFVPATLVPLGTALFVEGLLRRHLPLALKLLAAGGSALFLALDLFGLLVPGSSWIRVFAGFEALLLAALGWIVVRRDRASLSPAENRFIEIVLVTLLLSIPLVLTDFRGLWGWPPARLGSLAVLLFAFVLVRSGSSLLAERRWLPVMAGLAGRAAVLALALGAVLGAGDEQVWHLAATSMGFVLLAAIWQRFADARAEVRRGSFLGWLASADTHSLDGFLAALADCPAAGDYRYLAGPALDGYHARELASRLEIRPVASLPALKAALREETRDPCPADEQLIDLLERHGMEHACLVRAHPLALLLLAHAPLGGSLATDLEIAVVQKRAALLGNREATNA